MTTRHRFYAHRSEGNVHPCPECNGTGKHESTGKCIKCDGLGKVVTPTTDAAKVAVTRCDHCGLERWGLTPADSDCPRCNTSAAQQYTRWLDADATMLELARNQSRTG